MSTNYNGWRHGLLRGAVDILGDLPDFLMERTFILAFTWPLTALVGYSQATGESSFTTFSALLANGQMLSLYAGFGLAVSHAVYYRLCVKSWSVVLRTAYIEPLGSSLYDFLTRKCPDCCRKLTNCLAEPCSVQRGRGEEPLPGPLIFWDNVFPIVLDGRLCSNFCSWGWKSEALRQSVSAFLERNTTTTANKVDLVPNCYPEGWTRSLSMVTGGGTMGYNANWNYNITNILLFKPIIRKLFGSMQPLRANPDDPYTIFQRLTYYALVYPFQTLRTRCALSFDWLEANKEFMALPLLQRLMYVFVGGSSTMAAVTWVSSSETQLDSSYLQGLYAGFFTFLCAGVVEFGAYKLWKVLPFRGWYFRLRGKLPSRLRPDHWYWVESESDDSDSDSDSD